MNYIASVSFGKDSLAMVLKIIETNLPLSHVVFYDTGMEFDSIYIMMKQAKPIIEAYGAKLIVIKPEISFLEKMMLTPVHKRDGSIQYGFDWCGGRCRWATNDKIKAIKSYMDSIGQFVQYVGIAYDEPERIKKEDGKLYPLVDFKMTEKDCLDYCYSKGFYWEEDGVRLYDILDRVSCFCCSNKNLNELRAMYHFLPKYWTKLKAMQSRIDRPFRSTSSIFDLEQRFICEDSQLTIYDL